MTHVYHRSERAPADAPTVPPHASSSLISPAHLMPMNFSSDSLRATPSKACKLEFYGRVLRRERLTQTLEDEHTRRRTPRWLPQGLARALRTWRPIRAANRWHFVPKWRRSFDSGGEKWAWRRMGGHGIEHVTTSCSDFGGRVCYVAAGTLRGKAPPTVFSALTRLFALDVIAPEDIIVVNEGAWFYAQDSNSSDAVPPLAHKVTEHVGELLAVLANRTALAHRSNATMPRIIWRETFAQHFATHDGLYLNPKTASTPATCVASKPRAPPSTLYARATSSASCRRGASRRRSRTSIPTARTIAWTVACTTPCSTLSPSS